MPKHPQAPLTPEQFLIQMRKLETANDNDPEVSHSDADELMAETLSRLGYYEGIRVYRSLTRYYA